MKRLTLIVLCLLPLLVMGQEAERLRPLEVVSIVPVPKDTTHYERYSPGWQEHVGDSQEIDYFECRSDTGVVGYLLKAANTIGRWSLEFWTKNRLLDDAGLTEVQRTEEVLAEVLNLMTDSVQKIPEVFTAPRYYRFTRQYIIYLDTVGDTCAFVNCMMNDNYNHPERRFVDVCDGGDNYWRVKLNLTQRRLLTYNINGPEVTYVGGRSREPQGLDSLSIFGRWSEEKEYFKCYYGDLPRAVRRHIPKEHSIDCLTRYEAFRYRGEDYYTISFSDGTELGFDRRGHLLYLFRRGGLTQQDLKKMTGSTRVTEAVVREVTARGCDFSYYSSVKSIERVRDCFVVSASFPVSGMSDFLTVANITIDKHGRSVGIAR